METSCYTYFAIKGDFSPDEVTNILKLKPTKKWAIGDLSANGSSRYDFALWEYGRCDEYEIDVEKQCLKTICDLKSKTAELKAIKETFDVAFVLEIVPSVIVNETHPALCFNRDIIEFCYLTETYIDIDMYVYDLED